MELESRRLAGAADARRRAWFLSIAGFFPFAFFALCIVWFDQQNPLRPLVIDSMKIYGAIILSFLGGIRWGIAMKSENVEKTGLVFSLSVLPSIIGWLSLFLPLPYVFAVQALGFAGQGAWDSFAAQHQVYGLWFARLRSTITFLVVACLVVAFFATI